MDCKAYDALIDLPEQAPDALLADKGYDADAIRAGLADRKIEVVIPGRSNRRVKIDHDRTLYKQRNRIERMFGQPKIKCDQSCKAALQTSGRRVVPASGYWFADVFRNDRRGNHEGPNRHRLSDGRSQRGLD